MTKHTTTPTPAPQVATSAATSVPLIAMILGVISLTTFTWFLGIPAAILGIIGLRKYSENRGFSITGIITGAISTLLMLAFIAFFFVVILLGIFSAENTSSGFDDNDGNNYRHDRGDDQYYREGA